MIVPMILTCPDCATRYTVDEAALRGTAGRDVRCAKCGKVWHYHPESTARREPVVEIAASADETPEKAAAIEPPPLSPPPTSPLPSPPRSPLAEAMLRAEPRLEPAPPEIGAPPQSSLREPVLDRDRGQAERPPARRRRHVLIAGIALGGVVLVLAVAAFLARDLIMSTWPATAPLYRSVRLADSLGAGLQVTVSPARTPDSLVINGKITNIARTVREVPRLRIALHDSDKAEVASQVIDPPRNSLAPGATAAFSTIFKNPDRAAIGVAVTFAPQ